MRIRTIFTAVALVATIAACTSGKTKTTDSPAPTTSTESSAPSTSASTSPIVDPQAQPAVDAYLAFRSASYASERKPTDRRLDAALAGTAVRPALANELGTVLDYQKNDIAFRGAPPRSRPSVVSINLSATPQAVATVADCPILSPTWAPYAVKTGQRIDIQYTGKAKPPYRATAIVVLQKSKWVVQTLTTHMDATCVG